MELVDFQDAGGCNLAIELSVRFFIFATFLMFFKDCSLLACLSQRAVLLTPRDLFLGAFLIPGIRFWVLVDPAELGLTFVSPWDCMSG